MNKFKNLFGDKKVVIGMIHTDASPGTFNYKGNINDIIEKALKEALIFEENGLAAVMIENMHDLPYINRNVGHEVSTLMSIIAYEIKQKTDLKCGIQILAGANMQALAAANSAGIDFIRAESYVFSHIADEGIMHSDAGELRRYQKMIRAEDILIFTDIKKKHSSHVLTDDINILEFAKAAQFFLSDGVIITGSSTGEEANVNEAELIKTKIDIPVLIGSGVNEKNISTYFPFADAFIIGSCFKRDGYWANNIDPERLNNFMNKYYKLF